MKKLLLLLLAVCCLLVVGCQKTDPAEKPDTGTSTGTGTSAPVTVPPDTDEPDEPDEPAVPVAEPNSIVVDRIRVQLLSDRLVRIEMQNSKGEFEDRPSFTVLNRTEWTDVPYTIRTEENYTVIATAGYKVCIPTISGRTLSGVYVTNANATETLWEYTTATSTQMFLPTPSSAMDSWYFMDSPRVIPSEGGYVTVDSEDPLNGWDLSSTAQDAFVFLPDGSYKDFMQDYVKLTGSSEMVTLGMLGFWDSRYYTYSAETALQQIKDYQEKGYSIDVLVVDTAWRSNGSGTGYEINTELFPDMADFLEKAHELGVSIVFNDHPEPVAGTENLVEDDEINYRTDNLKLILSMGLDTWWYDRNWTVALNPITDGLSRYTTGMYAFQFITEDYYESIKDSEEYARRALIMANVDGILNGELKYPAELAAHRYSIQWTGDIGSTIDNLYSEIFNAVYGGAKMGIPYISCDLGGHVGDVTEDMYIRWMQYGALSPIFRVHCGWHWARMPWVYGEKAETAVHTYEDLRYRLLPLYYSLAHDNYVSGLPLIRRPDINYPELPEAAINDEYLLGDYILVAPLTESSETIYDLNLSYNGQSGLYAEYFENTDLSGDPALTQQENKIYYEYGFGGPEGLSVVDDFSIRWTGEVTIGEEDTVLQFFANLGLRVWLDGEQVCDEWEKPAIVLFHTEKLAAGSTHTIKIEYFTQSGGARCMMYGLTDIGASRDVFLPDGEWMDVWTGETYAGPTTITVTHGVMTSPIFVRMGSIIPLADVAVNTGSTDWSHLTLDVYPSTSNDASYTLYEDDTQTVAYKDGHYRTTDMTLSETAENQLTLKIAAAKGEFTGELAFDTREWTIRVHGREGWGALTGVTLGGKAVDFTVIEKNPDAEPLANQGGARDGVVYEITFTASVNEKSSLVLTFADTAADAENEEYDRSAVDFTVTVNKLTKSTAAFNATERGTLDWVVFAGGEKGAPVRKAGVTPLIGELTGEAYPLVFLDEGSNYEISWNDGDAVTEGSSQNRYGSTAGFHLTLKASEMPVTYKLYIGASKNVTELTIRDRAGNAQTVALGNVDANIYREVVITCSADTETELYMTYSGNGTEICAATAAIAE